MDAVVRAELKHHGGKARLLQTTRGRLEIHLVRQFDSNTGTVWSWLTDPRRLEQWSPVVPDGPLTEVGVRHSHESPDSPTVACDVLQVETGRMVRHRWGQDDLAWGVEPSDAGTRLTLCDEVNDVEDAAMNAAGWDLCLAVLAARLGGERVDRIVGEDALAAGWEKLHDHYRERFAAGPESG